MLHSLYIQGIWWSSFDESAKGKARPYCLLALLASVAAGNHFVTKSDCFSFWVCKQNVS